MLGGPESLPTLPFELKMRPSASEVGRLWVRGTPTEAVVLFCFGSATASQRVRDVWTACCEIYLQAQLARRGQPHWFSLLGEQLFEIFYVDRALVCTWSPEHVFAVDQGEFACSCETLVEQVVAETSNLGFQEFVRLGASLILSRPQFALLKDLELRS